MSTPRASHDPRYGDPSVGSVPWSDVEHVLRTQEMACLSTVRADGRPHVTPLLFVWVDGPSGGWPGRLLLHTGEGEQKTLNLDASPSAVLAVAQPSWASGLDVAVEGDVRRRPSPDDARVFATELAAKHPDWVYEVDDQGLVSPDDGRRPVVLEVEIAKVLAFGRGERSSQTRFVSG